MPKRRTLLPPDQRRQQLLDAAIWVFARKGYRTAGVSDIIARAGVARGTFYLHFDSKQQVFLAIVEDFHARITRALASLGTPPVALAPADALDPRAMLEASFTQWLAFFAANRDQTRVVLKEASSIDPRFEKGYADLRGAAVRFFATRYRRFQSLDIVRASLDPDLMAHLLIGMFDELLNAFVLRDPAADLAPLAAQLADFEWNGIRPDRKESI
jgi:AcrR family transcriptional regulator